MNGIYFAGALIFAVGVVGATLVVLRPDPNNLPHRPLSQIDIQGHQPMGRAPTGAWCPGQYGYYLPSDNDAEIFLYCWGAK